MAFKAILCNKHNTDSILQMLIGLCEIACICTGVQTVKDTPLILYTQYLAWGVVLHGLIQDSRGHLLCLCIHTCSGMKGGAPSRVVGVVPWGCSHSQLWGEGGIGVV